MALTIKEALDLKEGVILSFGNEYRYWVVDVEPRDHGRGVHLTLKRDDGFDTYATHHDLYKVTIGTQPTVADALETIVTPNVTAEELEVLGSDPDIQRKNAVIADEESTELPPEPSPTEDTPPKDQDGDDTAVDNKPAPKGKGKSKK